MPSSTQLAAERHSLVVVAELAQRKGGEMRPVKREETEGRQKLLQKSEGLLSKVLMRTYHGVPSKK